MTIRGIALRMKFVAVGISLLVWGLVANASDPDVEQLTKNYHEYLVWKNETQSSSDISFYLKTEKLEGGFKSSMGITSEFSLQEIANSFGDQRVWCEFILLHLNVKSCVTWTNDSASWITFYMGKKSYQHPDDAEPLKLEFRVQDDPDMISVEMFAKEGPYGTSDYRIQLYVIPVEDGIYGELRMSQRFGLAAETLSNFYLKTIGKNKVGFTETGRDEAGQIKFVGGQQGVAERNIVRYLLAIDVFLKTRGVPGEKLFNKRAELWFDETERYKRQLHEISRKKYLNNKRREYQNQIELQKYYDGL